MTNQGRGNVLCKNNKTQNNRIASAATANQNQRHEKLDFVLKYYINFVVVVVVLLEPPRTGQSSVDTSILVKKEVGRESHWKIFLTLKEV